MKKNIGVDLGASFIKIGFLSKEGLSDIKRIPTPAKDEQEGLNYELDANLLVKLVKNLIDEYIQKDNSVEGIYFSTQMHGFVLYDYQSGENSPYISWKDRRAEKYFIDGMNSLEYLKNTIPNELVSKTGMKFRSGLPSVNLFVLQHQSKLSSRFSFGTIADYVVAKLTSAQISTSLTNAAGSGLFDLKKNNWNYHLIELLGLKVSLPTLILKKKVIGQYSGKNIYSPIGDQQAALLGIDNIDFSNTAVSNIATGSQATLVSPFLELSDEFQTRPFTDGQYLYTIPFIPAGRVINSLVLFLSDISSNLFNHPIDFDKTWELVIRYSKTLKQDSTQPMIVNTDFIGSYSVDGGSICQIHENNLNLKNFLLGFFIDVVDNHVKSLKILNKYNSFNEVVLTGGIPNKLPIIMSLFKSKINKKIHNSKEKEDALNGLRKLAFSTVGSW